MTLAQLAERTGLSASALSQIERGVTDPSIGSLRRIASALQVPFFRFLLECESPDPVVRKGQRRTISFPDRALQTFAGGKGEARGRVHAVLSGRVTGWLGCDCRRHSKLR